MTIDQQQILSNLKSVLPDWFGDAPTPILDAVLNGYAQSGEQRYLAYLYVQLQTRIKTATDVNLDLISVDFFGNRLKRKNHESDDLYRKRILATLLQEKATLFGMKNAIKLLTGIEPIIIEPGYIGSLGMAYDVAASGGLDIAGVMTESMPYQCFIIVFVDNDSGMAPFGGLDTSGFGLDVADGIANNYLGEENLIGVTVTDQDIYNLINDVKCYGTICWVSIERGTPPDLPQTILDKLSSIITDLGGEVIFSL